MTAAKQTISCAVSGESLAAQSAIWLVTHPDTGEWFVDIAGKWPGEKTPIICEADVLRQALAARGMLPEQIEARVTHVAAQLHKEALSWLPLALKSGELIMGFDSVNKALRAGNLRLLIHARDGSEDGLRKLAGIARSQDVMIVSQYFSLAELASTLGVAGSVVHLGLTRKGLEQSFLRSCQRLAGFSTQHKL